MIDRLLSRLNGTKRTGQDRYVALCPSHGDKNPSLAIQKTDGIVLLHCFAGCSPADVLASVGLTFADLYSERPQYNKGKRSAFNPYDVLKCLVRESAIVAIAAAQLAKGAPLSTVDIDRITLAHDRLYEAARLIGVRL